MSHRLPSASEGCTRPLVRGWDSDLDRRGDRGDKSLLASGTPQVIRVSLAWVAHVCMCVHAHVCAHAYTCSLVCTCVTKHVCVCICVYVCTSLHVHTLVCVSQLLIWSAKV